MDEHLLYSVERMFDVPVNVMWSAWTTASALEAWYHPTELSVVPGSATSEATVGGAWSIGIDASEFGFTPYFYGQYTEVVPHERLRHTMHYTESAEAFAAAEKTTPFHEIEIDFSEDEGGTTVTFRQIGDLPDDEAARAKAGMESYFDSLAAYLAETAT